MKPDKNIYIHPHCNIINGFSRGLIQDTFRGEYHFIPKLLASLMPQINDRKLSDFKNLLTAEKQLFFDEYITFLRKKEIAFFSDSEISYKKMNLSFDYPAHITNAIVIYNETIYNKLLINKLSSLNCENIQLFFSQPVAINKLNELLALFDDSIFQNIEIVIPFQKTFLNVKKWENLFEKIKRLQSVVIFNAPKTEKISMDCLNYNFILFIADSVSYKDCGVVHPLRFRNNLPFFTESQAHNTCLNRKLCIDAEGNIKNCPALQQSFGNIQDTSLQETIEKTDFKDLWYIHKDRIDVCKDCEFRYMCTDCRCFIKDPENIYSQPAKCTYNPYICKWQGQKGYVPVEECGTYSKKTGFIPDKIKIANLNKQIWGEDDD